MELEKLKERVEFFAGGLEQTYKVEVKNIKIKFKKMKQPLNFSIKHE